MHVEFDGRYFPADGLSLVKQMIDEAVTSQTQVMAQTATNETMDHGTVNTRCLMEISTAKKLAAELSYFHVFLRLPQELQSMIIEQGVTNARPVMLYERNGLGRKRHHAKQCCGKCRVFEVTRDDECCCPDNLGNHSSTCECVRLSSSIFLVSKAARSEALKLYWKVNTFIAHGTMDLRETRYRSRYGRFEQNASVWQQIQSIDSHALPLIRRLIICTDSPAQSLDKTTPARTRYLSHHNAWGQVLSYLEAHSNPCLQIEIRISQSHKNIIGSHMWLYTLWQKHGQVDGVFHDDSANEDFILEHRFAGVSKAQWPVATYMERIVDVDDERRMFIEGVRKLNLNVAVSEQQETLKMESIVVHEGRNRAVC